jgi:hypothetical protein
MHVLIPVQKKIITLSKNFFLIYTTVFPIFIVTIHVHSRSTLLKTHRGPYITKDVLHLHVLENELRAEIVFNRIPDCQKANLLLSIADW